MRASALMLGCLLVVATATVGAQQKPSAYPAKGQSAEAKAQDDGACQTWAKQETGIDPAVVAATPAPATGPQGERVAGAFRGATAGAIIGGVTGGSASDGAAVGATVGVIGGGRAARKHQAAQTQQAQAAQTQALDAYWRAWGGCMSSRGYTVQ